jgi:hypothetical protein
MKFNTMEIYENKKIADKNIDNQKHIHLLKNSGSSNLLGCTILNALKNCDYKLP